MDMVSPCVSSRSAPWSCRCGPERSTRAWTTRLLVASISTDGSPLFVDLAMDWRMLGFTPGITVLTCVLFGLAPALRATRVSPGAVLKSSGRSATSGRARFGLRRVLVVSQIAMSLMLVVGAILFARSLQKLATLDAGFTQNGVLELDLDLTALHLPVDRRAEFKGWRYGGSSNSRLVRVIAYMVERRTSEIGIRMALGADRASIVHLVLPEASVLLGLGLLIGMTLSLAGSRVAATMLFGLKPTDFVTYVLAVASLSAFAALASFLPARRASRLDPLVALRNELVKDRLKRRMT